MKTEEQVTSLELSKKLKELDVKQVSIFYWLLTTMGEYEVTDRGNVYMPEDTFYSAFTVAELGLMFGKLTILSGYIPRFKYYSCRYFYSNEIDERFEADTEADARAKMLIYLAENGLIELQAKHS